MKRWGKIHDNDKTNKANLESDLLGRNAAIAKIVWALLFVGGF